MTNNTTVGYEEVPSFDFTYNSIQRMVVRYVYGTAVAGSFLIVFVAVTVLTDLVPVLKKFWVFNLLRKIVTLLAISHVFLIYEFMPGVGSTGVMVFWGLSWFLFFMSLWTVVFRIYLFFGRLIIHKNFSLAIRSWYVLRVGDSFISVDRIPKYITLRRHENVMVLDYGTHYITMPKTAALAAVKGLNTKYKYKIDLKGYSQAGPHKGIEHTIFTAVATSDSWTTEASEAQSLLVTV